MSTTIGLGFPVLAPLLPVTGTFAVPFATYFTWLSLRVVRERLRDKHYMGDNSSKGGPDNQNRLFLAMRAHLNFAENVPLGLVLAAVAELNGANRRLLTGALGALFAFRFLHAEAGLIQAEGMGKGRPVGYFGTLASLIGMATYSAWLVKSYWSP